MAKPVDGQACFFVSWFQTDGVVYFWPCCPKKEHSDSWAHAASGEPFPPKAAHASADCAEFWGWTSVPKETQVDRFSGSFTFSERLVNVSKLHDLISQNFSQPDNVTPPRTKTEQHSGHFEATAHSAFLWHIFRNHWGPTEKKGVWLCTTAFCTFGIASWLEHEKEIEMSNSISKKMESCCRTKYMNFTLKWMLRSTERHKNTMWHCNWHLNPTGVVCSSSEPWKAKICNGISCYFFKQRNSLPFVHAKSINAKKSFVVRTQTFWKAYIFFGDKPRRRTNGFCK